MNEPPPSGRAAAWRVAAGVAVLAGLSLVGALLAPVYFRNLELERYLQGRPQVSDEVLKRAIIEKGSSLRLNVVPDHVQVRRSPTSGQVSVRYVVRVDLSLYTVDLHFSSNISPAAK
ncbi:MAG TPA: hypothetical protein VLX58_09430 [Bryobacteraceae bacterium]|nr:hypothetical protein [Bryobacteraceae bacterium]